MNRAKDLDFEPARYLNLVLGAWLLVSAFMWPHSEPQFIAAIVVGAVLTIVAPFEVGSPAVRRINTAAGVVLVVAAVVLPRTTAVTLWHNVLLGLIVMSVSFCGPPHGITRPRPPAPDDAYDATGGV
ncbi:MAG TPA: hypothetical protein VHL80_07150 [Polyangia bacterium]|nr:hypothetical protein [Polyangia bacterium]